MQDGSSPHANTAVHGRDRQGLEALLHFADQLRKHHATSRERPNLSQHVGDGVLCDERCVDGPSNLALIASVSKESPLKALATAKAGADGRFKMQVPGGRLFVRVETRRALTDYVVEPIDGVETVLKGNEPTTSRELADEIAALIESAEEDELGRDIWVIGQDNPQLVRLKKEDVSALVEGRFKGPSFFWGCSKVVTGEGRVLGTTCPPERERRGVPPDALELTGQVLLDGKPRGRRHRLVDRRVG